MIEKALAWIGAHTWPWVQTYNQALVHGYYVVAAILTAIIVITWSVS